MVLDWYQGWSEMYPYTKIGINKIGISCNLFNTNLFNIQSIRNWKLELETTFQTFQNKQNKLEPTSPNKHSSWWRRLEEVFRPPLQKTSWRRLQDVLIKTNIFTLLIRLQKTSSRRLAKTSSKRFQEVFKIPCSLFSIKLQTSGNPMKRRLKHRYFLAIFAKFLRKPL